MRDTPDALMLFAAGLGTRMRPLTDARPKPLIEVAGRTLIDHALEQARGVPLARIVANAHYRSGQLAAHLEGRPGVALSREDDLLRDTGGGLRHALPLLGEGPVFAMNTDAVWTGPGALAQLAEAWDPAQMDALLLLVPRAAARSHAGAGDFTMDAAGRLRRGPGHVYTGAQILRTERLAAMSEPVFSLNAVWDAMAAVGRLFGALHCGLWCDVGRPESIAVAEAMLAEAGNA
ncbi:MurNAc alpha-1-phosphate uridylyltransferase [Rhodovulum iodosum]|uniref:MurNAc alpha-1-phosphate uridylyltransferase n=1 Tax=Rhodovulum iodosum TaxID=68291 RepID=A0ABV3XRL8_9RHOB|nr:nucleotidyltransferase family protein [Rhodovulum robiginosum]RSK30305.1 nucleotidyltransferase family protein [Rhodovulum robiginosum]